MSLDRGMLAKIHIAKKELGFDDDAYRDILQTRYKKDSAAKLTRFEGDDLIRHFKAQGFRVKTKKAPSFVKEGVGGGSGVAGGSRTASTSAACEKPMARKVVAIWVNLALAGKLRNGSDAALQSWVKRMTGVEHLSWCDDRQLWKLVEALKSWAKREEVDIDG